VNADPVPPVIRAPGFGSRAPRFAALVVALALAFAVTMLFFYDPAKHSLYPQCTLKKLTGLDCPGCGGLRATHQLLHGNIRAAFALNPLLFLVAPVIAWWLAAEAARHRGRNWRGPFDRTAGVLVFVGAVLVFGLLRNVWPLLP